MNSNDNVWEDNESFLNRGGLALMGCATGGPQQPGGAIPTTASLRTIQDSVIENNVVAGNSRGFFVYDAEFNVLRNNLVMGNRVGVHLGRLDPQRCGWQRLHPQPRADPLRRLADEEWGQRAGNLSNYVGWDADADGVGDVPTRRPTSSTGSSGSIRS